MCHENRARPSRSRWQAPPSPAQAGPPGRGEIPPRGEDPGKLTHRVHVKEERMLVLAGVETFDSVHQGWVSIVEVRMGNEYWCIWMRTKTP